ncbi:hypothetical protein GCM10017786_20060 [Amycolatopsis deserti]|uniref:Uncharacterized protein n=2 Tax=Amycolatopsis deserti TaxID=185696 RepID=A0ABQ3IMM0_9PSEU|nr:hypothetical protein GCM10017786_20060 [Amycolatopsis deserti]
MGTCYHWFRNYPPGLSNRPLFVSEGSSKAKLQTIGRLPCLTFCLNSLRRDQGNTVIFGHSFSNENKRSVAALNDGASREFAVSIYPCDDRQWIIHEKVRIAGMLGEKTRFFDSATRPLGGPALSIQRSSSLA